MSFSKLPAYILQRASGEIYSKPCVHSCPCRGFGSTHVQSPALPLPPKGTVYTHPIRCVKRDGSTATAGAATGSPSAIPSSARSASLSARIAASSAASPIVPPRGLRFGVWEACWRPRSGCSCQWAASRLGGRSGCCWTMDNIYGNYSSSSREGFTASEEEWTMSSHVSRMWSGK
jgi:hypothetical protein